MFFQARRKDSLVGIGSALLAGVIGLLGLWHGVDGRIAEWGMRLAPDRQAPEPPLVVGIERAHYQNLEDRAQLGELLAEASDRSRRAGATVTALVLPPDWPFPIRPGQAAEDGPGPQAPLLIGLSSFPAPLDNGNERGLWPAYLSDSQLNLATPDPQWPARLGRLLGLSAGLPEARHLSGVREAEGISGAGFLPEAPGRDARAVIRVGELALPALSLHIAARMEGLGPADLEVGEYGIRLGDRRLPTDARHQLRPYFYRARGDDTPLERLGLDELLADDFDPGRLANRTVLIGPTEGPAAMPLPVPSGQLLSTVEVSALHAAAIHQGHLYSPPEWGRWLPWAGLLAVMLYLMFLLPRLATGPGLFLSLLLAAVLFNLQLILPTIRLAYLDLAMPLFALLGGQGALAVKQHFDRRRERLLRALSDANRLLAESLRKQGMTDAAFERLQNCEPSAKVLDSLYELALDLERKREFARAQAVLKHLLKRAPGFRDGEARIRKLAELETRTALGNKQAGGRGLVLSEDGMQKPVLGRYEIEEELGRGAMGVVYLGKDPRIGRTVAIKTMALAQEFEGDDLVEVTDRFFREAETAGRLQHPGIVTIYDVGEEADLAYIAMDYLEGKGLQHYTDPDKLLPATTVCDIAIQVAEALDYAHGRNVVHRDIKPANMIYVPETGRVVLTDFGVACLTDASKTKTGTILGTPSYMSPEQVLGRKVDGRSDLFSLGVTLYQMLRGELPFRGEPLATLLYKIANDKTPNVTRQRPDLPPCIGRIIKRAMAKKPGDRFESGSEMAAALRRCRKEVASRLPERPSEGKGNGSEKGD